MHKLSELAIVRELADQICQRITRATIRILQSMDARLSPDDSGLKNPWDEVCVQMQHAESIYWDTYVETINGFVGGEVEILKKFEQEAVWLQTPQGSDWDCEDEDTRDAYPVFVEDIVSYIVSDYVLQAATDWSNPNIRAFLERAALRD